MSIIDLSTSATSRSSTSTGVDVAAGGDLLGRVEREAAGEHREAPEHRALALGQQLVAPVDRRLQRLLAGQHRARAAGEQPEAVVEPGRDLLDRSPRTRAAASSTASGMPSRR